MTTYFVTGATGFLGRRLVATLLARPACERVFALVRPHSAGKLPAHPKLTEVVGDLTAPIDGPRVDHVVHLGALYDLTASLEEHTAVNVDGTPQPPVTIDGSRLCPLYSGGNGEHVLRLKAPKAGLSAYTFTFG